MPPLWRPEEACDLGALAAPSKDKLETKLRLSGVFGWPFQEFFGHFGPKNGVTFHRRCQFSFVGRLPDLNLDVWDSKNRHVA